MSHNTPLLQNNASLRKCVSFFISKRSQNGLEMRLQIKYELLCDLIPHNHNPRVMKFLT